MDKIVQIKYARGLRYAKNKICLILGIDEGGTVILARSSSLSWKIPKDLISHLVKCNFTSKESKKLNVVLHASSKHDRLETLFMLTHINPEIRNKIRVNLNLVQGYIDNKIEVLKAIRLLSNVYHVKTIKLNELQNSDKYVSFENIFLDCELSSPYAHGCQTDITHYFDSLSLMHDIQILLKRSCFLVEPSKTATFSDLVKVVGKRIKNEKHKFGVLYENGKLESHWLTNEEINNKTR